MAIFSVINTAAGGDTFYEGMVKAAENWAIMEGELTNARNGQASLAAAIALKVIAPNSNTADYVPQWSGANSKTLKDGFEITAAGKALLDDANAGAQLTTLGLTAFVKTLMDDAAAATFLTTLGISAFVQTILNDADAAGVLGTLGCETTLADLTADEIGYVRGSTSTPAANKAAIRDASGNVLQAGKVTSIHGVSFIDGQPATSTTEVDISSAVSVAARFVWGHMTIGANGGAADFSLTLAPEADADLHYRGVTAHSFFSANGQTLTVPFFLPILTSQSLWYKASGNTNAWANFMITGYIE